MKSDFLKISFLPDLAMPKYGARHGATAAKHAGGVLASILGLLEPLTSGSYQLAGEAVQGLSDAQLTLRRRRLLGFVFQFHHLLPAFSALENVTLPALMAEGHISAREEERARSLLDAVGLGFDS